MLWTALSPAQECRGCGYQAADPKASWATVAATSPRRPAARLGGGMSLILPPSYVGGGRKSNAEGKPFGMKARPRIRTYLAEPIGAEGLNGACQKDDAKT